MTAHVADVSPGLLRLQCGMLTLSSSVIREELLRIFCQLVAVVDLAQAVLAGHDLDVALPGAGYVELVAATVVRQVVL